MDQLIELISNIIAGALGALVATAILKILNTVKQREQNKNLNGIDTGRRRGKAAVFISCFVLVSFAAWNEFIGPILSRELISSKVETLIHGNRWISYDPLYFDPYISPNPQLDSVKNDLKWIHDAGFDGIITFTSNDNFATIPVIAHNLGLKTIMGIWDPTNVHEIAAANSKRKYVAAYVVGHNGLGEIYSYDDLLEVTRKIRFRTRRPVSTTEKLQRYLDDARLLEIGDWIFPDCHVSVKGAVQTYQRTFFADAIRDAKNTIKMANMIAMKDKSNKPVLLKMITYPMAGISNASLEEQAAFFYLILESRRDSISDMPSNVSLSVHSAFDTPWKRGGAFYDWDPYTGLFNNDGSPRAAVHEIISRFK